MYIKLYVYNVIVDIIILLNVMQNSINYFLQTSYINLSTFRQVDSE